MAPDDNQPNPWELDVGGDDADAPKPSGDAMDLSALEAAVAELGLENEQTGPQDTPTAPPPPVAPGLDLTEAPTPPPPGDSPSVFDTPAEYAPSEASSTLSDLGAFEPEPAAEPEPDPMAISSATTGTPTGAMIEYFTANGGVLKGPLKPVKGLFGR